MAFSAEHATNFMVDVGYIRIVGVHVFHKDGIVRVGVLGWPEKAHSDAGASPLLTDTVEMQLAGLPNRDPTRADLYEALKVLKADANAVEAHPWLSAVDGDV